MLGALALLLVHPTILYNSVNASAFFFLFKLVSVFFSCMPPCFFLRFLLLVLVFHCWESCRLGRGESVMGRWWLLRWLVHHQRYTRYAMLGECVSWSICVIWTYRSTSSVRFIRMNLIRMLILHIRIKLIHINHTDQLDKFYRFWFF